MREGEAGERGERKKRDGGMEEKREPNYVLGCPQSIIRLRGLMSAKMY